MPQTPDLRSLQQLVGINLEDSQEKKQEIEYIDDQPVYLNSFFKKFKPHGAFVYISVGSHTNIFNLPQIRELDAYAIDPFIGYSEESISKIQSEIETNPNHRLLKIKDTEAVDRLRSVEVGTVYMLNSYGNAINAVKMLKVGGYLVCNNYTQSVNEARKIDKLELVGVLANDSKIIDERDLNLYFKEIDSYNQFVSIYAKNKELMSIKTHDIRKLLKLHNSTPENEILEIWFDLINLYKTCPVTTQNLEATENIFGEGVESIPTTIVTKNLSKIKQFLSFFQYEDNLIDLDSNLMLGNTIIPMSFTIKTANSNDLFIFKKI